MIVRYEIVGSNNVAYLTCLDREKAEGYLAAANLGAWRRFGWIADRYEIQEKQLALHLQRNAKMWIV
jgi:hypothetical protein